jgi:predicted P-loop ATPase/GTPase
VLYPASSSAALMDELIAKGLNISVALPQGLVSNLTLLYSPHIEKISTKTALYGLNKESAIEEIVEVGSTINEVDKFIKNQTELMTISENSGFRKILKKSSAIMTIE